MNRQRDSIPWLAIGLLSGAALGYEVLLTRLFSLVHWHHLVGTVISLALLGFGASGTFLTLFRERLLPRYAEAFTLNALVFSLSAVGCFLLAQQVPLRPLELAWDFRQLGYMAVIYALLAIPFFAVANCIGLTLARYHRRIPSIYAVDLLGAGAGVLAVIGLLLLLHPQRALLAVGLIGLGVAALSAWETGLRGRWAGGMLAVGVAVFAGIHFSGAGRVNPADYKDMSQAMQTLGAEVESQLSDPLGVVSVLRNDRVPLRHAPGLSLASPQSPPEQRAVFLDGDAIGAMTRFDGNDPPAYSLYLTSALPYAVLENPRVLVPRAGVGAAVLQALAGGAEAVTGLEPNARLVDLVQNRYAGFTGGLFQRPQVSIRIAEMRPFVATPGPAFDLIQLDLLGGGGAGLHALREDFLHTVEAFEHYLERLDSGGMVAVTRWLQLPPKDSLKLVATAREALSRVGAAEPARHLALIRGWKTSTLLVSRSPLSDARIEAIRRFSRERSFDVAWIPGIRPDEVNRFNQLERPFFYEGARALLGTKQERQSFLRNYKFDLAPATDDRPFFHGFSRWSSVPEMLSLPGGAGLGQVDWGYWIQFGILLQALALGGVLILLPLWVARLGAARIPSGERLRVVAYFGALGLAFMFVELAFIQRFQLFLGHAVYAVAVVLAGFLVFAGIGSRFSQSGVLKRRGPAWAVASIAAIGGLYVVFLPGLFDGWAGLADPLKFLLSLGLIAPLAFAMGIPFPLGLSRLSDHAPQLTPWAWGINGCASVTAAAAAPLIAVEIGFSGLVLLALLLYATLLLTVPEGR